MYESFYELRERPFALTPDPEYLYPSRVHQEALSYLRYGVESHAGFVVITGEIGSGKTTLLQALLNGLDGETTVARLVNTMLQPHELLEAIMFDFGLDVAGLTKSAMLRTLARFLVSERQVGRLVLLVVDEAQNLDLPALEEIRMLSNLETEKSKLIQIVLVGQPNLRDKLLRPELEQLRQRITVSYHLDPLDADETAAYINHRLRLAARGAPPVFPSAVTDLVYERSKGVPRLVNVICDAVLVFGYAEERRDIGVDLLDEVLVELDETGVLPAKPPDRGAAAVTSDMRSSASFVREARVAPPAERAPEPVDLARLAAERAAAGPAAARRMAEREEYLRSREQEIAERERELVEQKRVLAEECRLLRERFAQPLPTFVADESQAWPPARRTAGMAPAALQEPAAFGDGLLEPERERRGFWRRMRTFLVGPVES